MNDIRQVMVTGASRGIGKSLALELAKDYQVIGVSRSEPEFSDAGGGIDEIHYRSGIDFTKKEDLDSLTNDLAACDAVINNVGLAHDGILATQSFIDIEQMLNTNLVATIYLTKLYLRERLAVRKAGIVVMIGSVVAIRGYSGLSVYSATKGALGSLTRSLAREMGGKGFRFNTVLPGFIETEMTSGLSESQRNQIIRRTPLGRLGGVDDVSSVVRFLVSEESRFITGQEIVVDGGLSA